MLSIIVASIFFINIILIAVMIFWERKEPVYIFAWTLLLIFLPIVGFALYLLFGNGPRFKKRKSFQAKKKWDEQYRKEITGQLEGIRSHHVIGNVYDSIVKFNLNATKSLLTAKNDFRIYTNGKEKYKDLILDIQSAKKSIHVLYYIFQNDGIGNEIVRILEQKAKEGVQVRLVYDDVGSLHTKASFFKGIVENGGYVYPFFPSLFKIFGLNINYRNHRKIVVIDGVIAYTGGMNIGDEYMSKHPKLHPWRDTHIRIEGEGAITLQMQFLQDFSYAVDEGEEELLKPSCFQHFFPKHDWSHLPNRYMQVVASGPDTNGEELKDVFIKMMYTAQENLDIQTPYFVPDTAFIEAIRTACYSGVRVRLMIPKINDNHFVSRIMSSYTKELLEMGVELYEYKGFLHAKTMTIDNRITTVGTANLDIRSFKLNFEVNAFVYDIETATNMTTIFEEDVSMSERITTVTDKKWYIRAEESIYRLFSLLM